MRRFKLRNGLTVVYEQRDSDSVTLEISVSTGSNNETPHIAGMSHFLEHMVFEGTTTRTAKQISEAIENIGGELNAATSNERTFYYIKVPKSKTKVAFEILSDMMNNPAFIPKVFEKERKVILEEIKMVKDQPMLYQWVFFENILFKKHPTKNPVYGNRESVRSITRQQMISYFRKWYCAKNMTLSVVGDVKDLQDVAERYFGSLNNCSPPPVKKVIEPKDNKPTIKSENRNTKQAYLLIGYKTVPRTHKDSVVLDVISAIFSKGLSGRISNEIRVKRGLAYSVGTHNESKKDYGFIVVALNCDKKNLELCKEIVLAEIGKLGNIESKELEAAKEHIVGKFYLNFEDSQRRADNLAFWEFISDARDADRYPKDIKKVTVPDVKRVHKKYLGNNYTMVIIN
ncbi:insulinase family protein [Candidatus Woesearchaeota archaeon]|nr:insulinase family protein [Candidatus Woesearchaeota archaeon]